MQTASRKIQVTVPLKAAPPRHEMYLPVHKGLRAFMCEVLINVGRMDSTDDKDVADTLAQLRGLLMILRSHLKHENHFVHAAMEAGRAQSASQTASDHIGHENTIAQLEQGILQIEAAMGTDRAGLVTQLYRQLALFVAENLEHMHIEETDNTQVLWECYTDAQLMDIERRLVAAIPPDQNAIFLRWMLPHMTPAERARTVNNIRQHAPKPVFDGVMNMLQQTLPTRDWIKLANALT